MAGEDIIQCVLRLVLEADPDFDVLLIDVIDQRARHEWAGVQTKISRRGPAWRAAKEKARAEIGIKSPQQLQTELGLSRATLYRCIGKRKDHSD